MIWRNVAAIAVALAIVAVPGTANAGQRPPEGAEFTKSGTSNYVQARADKDRNGVAEKVDVTIGIYKCGNNVPVAVNGLKVNAKGHYSFGRARATNLAGQKVVVKVRGIVKNPNKVVQTTTIYKGTCEKTIKVTMTRGD